MRPHKKTIKIIRDRHHGRDRDNEPYTRIDFGTYICRLCGNVIADMTTAVAFGDEQQPAHIDCVIHRLEETEARSENEHVVYIGSGQFAIATLKPTFKIVRRIPVERKDSTPEWRRQIERTFFSVVAQSTNPKN